MPKKSKVGKQRKDKFYHLAKESGYRSRAAFKLVQLNRKFEFLQKSKVLVDLCAAPGGWLQVAANNMPVKSVIIGIDLVPIPPIPNVITLQNDITTEACRQAIKLNLRDWKADVFLNDGAPNVGTNWLHDSFSQAELTLSAFKLASEFLIKGGWFITKVFRSKDYQPLLYILKKFFKKVTSTKPQASRNESAEIFVVCQHYLAPDTIDPKFLDPRSVFKDIDDAAKPNSLLQPASKMKKVKAEGYADGEVFLYHTLPASKFIFNENYEELITDCNEIIFDDEKIENHPFTTAEIKECCKDVKVLGVGDIRGLIKWRKKLHEDLGEKIKEEVESEKELDTDEEMELTKDELDKSKKSELKHKKKKLLKEKKKTRDNKQDPNFVPLIAQDEELFAIKKIKTDLDLILDDPAEMYDDIEEEEESEEVDPRKRKRVAYSKEDGPDYEYDNDEKEESEDSDEEEESEDENQEDVTVDYESSDEEEMEEIVNPLIVPFDETEEKITNKWFAEKFNLDDEDETEIGQGEVEMMKMRLNKKKESKLEKESPKNMKKSSTKTEKSSGKKATKASATSSSTKQSSGSKEESTKSSEKENDTPMETEAPVEKKKGKKRKLDAEGLALGTILIRSKKSKRDIEDSSYNRYSFNDASLPDWFINDEKKHNRPNLPITKAMMNEQKERLKELDVRPIKKVAEAKARKKKRAIRQVERAQKKAESIVETFDMSDKEKLKNIKSIYKKAKVGEKKKNEVTYVRSKKNMARKSMRPAGVKGRYKMVDSRMKKDLKAQKMADQKGSSKKQKKGRKVHNSNQNKKNKRRK